MFEIVLSLAPTVSEAEYNRMLWSAVIISLVAVLVGVILIILFMRALEAKSKGASGSKSQIYVSLLIGMIVVLCVMFFLLSYRE